MGDGKDPGEPGKKPSALLFDGRRFSVADHRPVEEFPLALTVNAGGTRFTGYTHPWRIATPPEEAKIAGITGFDPTFQSLRNINTKQGLLRFREGWMAAAGDGPGKTQNGEKVA